jgi:hypothetical protein
MEVGGWSEGRTTGEPVENIYFRKMKACFPRGLRCKAKKLQKHSGLRPVSTARMPCSLMPGWASNEDFARADGLPLSAAMALGAGYSLVDAGVVQ